jgi:hypothetical protein
MGICKADFGRPCGEGWGSWKGGVRKAQENISLFGLLNRCGAGALSALEAKRLLESAFFYPARCRLKKKKFAPAVQSVMPLHSPDTAVFFSWPPRWGGTLHSGK